MQMLLAGEWVDSPETIEVRNPYDNSLVDTIPAATPEQIDRALAYAVEGAKKIRATSGYERSQWLSEAARLMRERLDELALTITREEGKILPEARGEVDRAAETLVVSAEEAKRLGSEVIPLDGAPGAGARFGFTVRVPCGVVVAITPFNFPVNLVCHKVGPALAAGNSIIIKPAEDTPLVCLQFARILIEAGAPPEAVQVVTGKGAEVGEPLCRDSRVRKISFTGSQAVGERITSVAGVKKVTLELGSNSPVVVLPDADLDKAAEAIATTGYSNAGQVCISAQRIVVDKAVYGDLIDALKPKVEALTTGDPQQGETKVGPLVREKDAVRVHQWIEEARAAGAKLVTGGERSGAVVQPAILADVDPEMKISRQELFGPAVALTPVASIDEAVALANDTVYGLSAAIFTENLDHAMRFVREVDAGNIHVNWGSQWRADLMPYGGLKMSGYGKEGPKYAVEEMTELKMAVLHLRG